MIRKRAVLGSVLGALFAPAAIASSLSHHHHHGYASSGYYPGYYIGYWGESGHWARSQRLSRTGPPYGYKFGWASYRGDPFAGQDYFDGHNCYYTYGHDYCL